MPTPAYCFEFPYIHPDTSGMNSFPFVSCGCFSLLPVSCILPCPHLTSVWNSLFSQAGFLSCLFGCKYSWFVLGGTRWTLFRQLHLDKLNSSCQMLEPQAEENFLLVIFKLFQMCDIPVLSLTPQPTQTSTSHKPIEKKIQVVLTFNLQLKITTNPLVHTHFYINCYLQFHKALR